jgi:hypothetical protein
MAEILPLALTMMIGPQIITAIILVTSKDAVRASLAFIVGVALAATTGTVIFAALAKIFDLHAPGSSEPSQAAKWIQTGLIAVLVAAVIKTYLNREEIMLPKWMGSLQSATPKKAFIVALGLIYIMPTDLLAMATVGINLASHENSSIKLAPFILLTVFIAALPLISYLAFGQRARAAMPKVRSWMNDNSWVVSIAAYAVFIFLLWS